jgi:outer membrane lipoprotein LolB
MMAIPFLSRFSIAEYKSAALLSVLLLSGCAALAPQPENAPVDAAQSAINRRYQDTLDLDGRLSVQYQRNNADESLHGSFTWRQTAQHNTITLLSPLGQTLATIAVEPGSATLTQSGHEPRTAADVDELAAQSLGWPLPVSGLRNWLQGFAVAADGTPFNATPATNTVTTGDGWQIHYVTWDESDPAHVHPKRIDLVRQTEQAGKVAIRIVIDNWRAR